MSLKRPPTVSRAGLFAELRANILALEEQKAELQRQLAEAEAKAALMEARAADAEAACDVFRDSAKGMEQLYLEEKARADALLAKL